MLKLDFAKAFDTIDHAAMLKSMGFDDKWLKWIELLSGSCMSSVLECLGGNFIVKGESAKGTLSLLSFLFWLLIFCNLPSIKASLTSCLKLPFLLTLLWIILSFTTLLYIQIAIMKEILETGLHINFYKSSIVPINLNPHDSQ